MAKQNAMVVSATGAVERVNAVLPAVNAGDRAARDELRAVLD